MKTIYFIADTHFFHAGYLEQYPTQPFYGPAESDQYDEWLRNFWNSKITKEDVVYIVGDFAYGPCDKIEVLLKGLNGEKHLIAGNHDEGSLACPELFYSVKEVEDLALTPTEYPFLKEDFLLSLCHYPVLSWNKKKKGACMVHGHCHGRIDKYNRDSHELRVDVGINADISRSCGGFISLEKLYAYFKDITGSKTFQTYIEENRECFVI